MPHSPEEQRKAISRLRRIGGQAQALERAIEAGADCGEVLQQLAALRGAVNGLVYEVLEGHLRETFGTSASADNAAASAPVADTRIDHAITLIRSYLK
ncbi:metal-sensing transcriptional repressor [Rhodoferax sp.]|uniref:metal-sensing transcriptional repressor n=1 Tax=Rhodoferax sp. TaxID=50421 RepID=UPI002622815B|nr:metal-sensing transcriptional repressor [Rhodoferax sp.]MDD2923959.1 metal-sensing transcriptional repressor [Rhodoferax sp.]